jgi:U3 small nucleolar RNA-associated protein 25
MCLLPCRLGIRITRGQIKLFADPMQSDIIVASPVGLATKLAEDAAAAAAAAADEGRGGGKKGGGGKGPAAGSSSSSGAADFLSSIEVCVLERADVMLMQNWQHVVTGGGVGLALMHDQLAACSNVHCSPS